MNKEIINAIWEQFREKGFKFFMKGSYNLNIFSVRSQSRKAGKFDDFIYCVYKDGLGNWNINQWKCTTDPGAYWLKNPSRIEGTAILCEGQYKGVYKLDKHQGRYTALCQRNGTVKVYRDSNRDDVLDVAKSSIHTGVFGINIHHAGENSTIVNKWSAGCTVFKRKRDFYEFMAICKKSKKKYGNKFTYTLFEE